MKPFYGYFLTATLAGGAIAAQPAAHYLITDLGPAGSPFAQATGINSGRRITGGAVTPDGTQHAVIWHKGMPRDISSPGLGGPNAAAIGADDHGMVLVQAESSASDPKNENFCGYGTGKRCLAALWHKGVLTALPLLGGFNSSAGGLNNRGEASGAAENGVADSTCTGKAAVNGNGPQVLEFKPVIWGPSRARSGHSPCRRAIPRAWPRRLMTRAKP